MKILPHVLGGLLFINIGLWVIDIVENFAVARRINDFRYTITATGWETIVAIWPAAAVAAVFGAGVAYFIGLFLGEWWVTSDFRKSASEVMMSVEVERSLLKSKMISIQNRREEMEREIRTEIFKIRRRFQNIREREKALEEREKNLAAIEKELAVLKTKRMKNGC